MLPLQPLASFAWKYGRPLAIYQGVIVWKLFSNFSVQFKDGTVYVYPDDNLKPIIGAGLNKECIITLYCCDMPNSEQLETVGHGFTMHLASISSSA